ncbi:hypothetical protein KKH05_00630 [Patescibacteria group bacterium]|nr:hypothetical protein [Patescibacteria group bacterium]
MKNSLEEEKWVLFLKKVKLFRFVPFTDFVITAGSLATGKLHQGSDFDVIVGAKQGRIFTNRFFAHLIFGLFGYRRKGVDHKIDSKDKICLSHFVTPASFRLSGPKNAYWQHLYQKLVPILGNEEVLTDFFEANDWLNPRRVYKRDSRYLGDSKSILRKFIEIILGGWFGDLLEKLKFIQIWVIKRGVHKRLGHKPAFVCSDDELRFHIDTKRIDEMVEKNEVR